jgi:hypothetical protein
MNQNLYVTSTVEGLDSQESSQTTNGQPKSLLADQLLNDVASLFKTLQEGFLL